MLTITPLTLHTKTDEVTSSLGRHLLPLALALFWVIFFLCKKKILRQPGIEPGTTAWEAAMLTITPLALYFQVRDLKIYLIKFIDTNVYVVLLREIQKYILYWTVDICESTAYNLEFKKMSASTGNRTQNNSLEGCYANHYTIDALGGLLIFEARNYIFKSKIQIQKEFASSGNRTQAARVAGEHSTTEPTMLTCYGSFRSHVRPEFTLKIMILTK